MNCCARRFLNPWGMKLVLIAAITLSARTSTFAIDNATTTGTPSTNTVVTEPIDAPWVDVDPKMPVSTNLAVYSEPAPISSPSQTAPPASPDLSTNFLALGDNNTSIPPDTHGAVGTNHIFTLLNSQYRMTTLGGQTIFSGSLSNFWSPIWPFAIQVFDPRVVYDTVNHRWIATALTGPRTVNSFILVAVSVDGTPTNGFYYARFKADTNNVAWADYPTVGLNNKWFVIHVNMFAIADNALQRAQIYVFNRTNWYAGAFANPTILYHTNANPGFPTAGLETPAVTYDTNVTSLYLVQSVVTNSNARVRMFSITGSIGSEILNTNLPYLQADISWNFSAGINFSPQLGLTNKIDNNDARIQNVVCRNGSLWFTHTVFLPGGTNQATRSAVQWWQVNPANWSIVQRGLIEDSSGVTFYAFPSIAVNRFNDVFIGYSTFGTNQYAAANYSFRAFDDPNSAIQGSRVLKAGEGAYYKTFSGTRNRWGDYSATVVDPRNDADMWTIQEYAATPAPSGLTNGTGRWGTWWGQIKVTVPSNDNFTNSISLSGTQGSTNGTNVRATKEPGEPNHAGNTNTVSVWYHWMAPTNGNVVFDTKGSLVNTLLGIYTGSSVSGLTVVTNDNDSGGGTDSQVVFNATAGTTYRIAVDGFAGGQSTFVLNWNQPTALVIVTQPQSQTVYQGNNVTFTANAIGRPDPTYQWRFNGANISGATSSSYTITGVQTSHAGNYTVIASNSSGSVTSTVASLTVLTSQATLSGPVVTNNTFKFTVSQVSGLNYVIEANTNLSTTNWIAIVTNTAPFTLTDTAFTNNPQRFYRAIYKP